MHRETWLMLGLALIALLAGLIPALAKQDQGRPAGQEAWIQCAALEEGIGLLRNQQFANPKAIRDGAQLIAQLRWRLKQECREI